MTSAACAATSNDLATATNQGRSIFGSFAVSQTPQTAAFLQITQNLPASTKAWIMMDTCEGINLPQRTSLTDKLKQTLKKAHIWVKKQITRVGNYVQKNLWTSGKSKAKADVKTIAR